ncbi:MAG: TOBE domain-containing protein [Sulfurimonas sp.]|uniref:TOBE domain-containing protein n=1 Tax=Sulfurimonas sp. TaxID=2022749 RepID=UPI00261C482E|nr:TOBE domain-containing protein [Sulfurimonas sp.]MCW8895665.1 TOBE domain-containing protein [Sulfurimonas sp.]MCW8955186.1 TOBE domain-containing protein [Sulfurimonas sp.]MCW9066901.1 TOBE domain-containing protein [Sulfurimonas sp.]
MNTLVAHVKEIKSVENLNIVKFDFEGVTLSMMSLELPESVKVGAKVKLGTKATHIAIAKGFSGEVSYSNQLHVKIIHVDNGELLSSIKLQAESTSLESIITRDSSDRMNLHVDDEVTAFIKANELSIVEVL